MRVHFCTIIYPISPGERENDILTLLAQLCQFSSATLERQSTREHNYVILNLHTDRTNLTK